MTPGPACWSPPERSWSGRAKPSPPPAATIDIVTIDAVDGVPSIAAIAVDADPPPVTIDPANDVVVMPYSSGTTGLPKGVMLTHRNLVANLAQIDALETRDLRAFVGVLPFFHIYGMVVIMNLALLRRATSVTLPRFDLETFLRVLQDWPISLAHIVPPIAVALAKHPIVDRYDLSKLRWLFSGAAPLGPQLTEVVQARLSVRVRQGYGMTEASPATHYTLPGADRAGKIGPLMPNTEGRIVDPETGADLGPGQAGEVWVRGPQVMKGYLNNPAATAHTVTDDGWLRTGDIGIVDDDGYLEIVDRLKELIKVKGFQVAPAELEALLLKHPNIADAAVIPVKDDECGEVPKAVVVVREPMSPEAVMAFVAENVAHYKRVRHVAFAAEYSEVAVGKDPASRPGCAGARASRRLSAPPTACGSSFAAGGPAPRRGQRRLEPQRPGRILTPHLDVQVVEMARHPPQHREPGQAHRLGQRIGRRAVEIHRQALVMGRRPAVDVVVGRDEAHLVARARGPDVGHVEDAQGLPRRQTNALTQSADYC